MRDQLLYATAIALLLSFAGQGHCAPKKPSAKQIAAGKKCQQTKNEADAWCRKNRTGEDQENCISDNLVAYWYCIDRIYGRTAMSTGGASTPVTDGPQVQQAASASDSKKANDRSRTTVRKKAN